MAFDRFGTGIKDVFRRVMGLGVVDREAVESIVRDLQRTLLQADVDVKLVFEMSQNIKNKVLKETPKGMTLKEYFIKTLYDEIVSLLGREKGKLSLEKQKILLIGLFGSGKCVHKDSLIPLATGEIKTIESIYEEAKKSEDEQMIEDGFRIEPKKSEVYIYSMNPKTLKMTKQKVSALWKLKHDSDLFKISLDNGNIHNITTTPEHPFFILENGALKKVRAENIGIGDYVAVPRELHFPKKFLVNLNEELVKFMPDETRIIDMKLSKNVRSILINKFITIENAHKKLKIKTPYCRFTYNLKRGMTPLYVLKKLRGIGINIRLPKNVVVKPYKSGKKIKIPLNLNEEFAEFLGYIFGEGYIYTRYLEITNDDKIILNRFSRLSERLFGTKSVLKRDKRRNKLYKVQISSKAVVEFIANTFQIPKKRKSGGLTLPDILIKSPNNVLKHFLRAYFDSDGYAADNIREVEFCSKSKDFILRLHSLLLRYGIVSTVSEKPSKHGVYSRLFIRSRYAELFAREISSNVSNKLKRLKKFKEIGKMQGEGKLDMISIGDLMKNVREGNGFSIGKMQNSVSSYGAYENKGRISRESLRDVIRVIKKDYTERSWIKVLETLDSTPDINYNDLEAETGILYPKLNAFLGRMCNQDFLVRKNSPQIKYEITTTGKNKLEELKNFDKALLKNLENIANSDIVWVKVKNIEKTDSTEEYVYDLTVDKFHNFVANGIIVHNTTTCGKLALWFRKRGLSVALVACDTHRAAAQDQLRQIGKQLDVRVYDEGRKPEDIAKNALKEARENVLVFDSAGRDALDGELAKELKKMGETIKPDEVFLVIPADIGQAARKQSEEFNRLVGITGIIITKMDGTAKGGGALSATGASGSHVRMIGVGEKIEDFEEYDPQRFVSRLIGYGDLQGLLEKAKEAGAEETAKKLMEGRFTLNEFHEQLGSLQKMGSLSKIMDMIPGMTSGGLAKKLPANFADVQEEKMKKWKHIINSMTPQEREDPDIIKQSRIQRIAKGSGTTQAEVRELLKNYNQIKKLLKMTGGGKAFKRGPFAKLAKQFGMASGMG